jgi:SAM-dependent methyltransferase
MRSGEQVFLDLGCAFAQDIRKLVADGVDSGQCYGSDLRLDYIELGYDLFRDKDSLKSKFIEADIFDPDSSLKELHGKVDIIGASSFFHLFSWDEQKKVAHRVVKLMKQQSGSLLVGRQVGSNEPAEKARRDGSGSRYRHNLESWKKMWQEVSHETGVRFNVDGLEIQLPEKFAHFREIGDLALQFTVRRV